MKNRPFHQSNSVLLIKCMFFLTILRYSDLSISYQYIFLVSPPTWKPPMNQLVSPIYGTFFDAVKSYDFLSLQQLGDGTAYVWFTNFPTDNPQQIKGKFKLKLKCFFHFPIFPTVKPEIGSCCSRCFEKIWTRLEDLAIRANTQLEMSGWNRRHDPRLNARNDDPRDLETLNSTTIPVLGPERDSENVTRRRDRNAPGRMKWMLPRYSVSGYMSDPRGLHGVVQCAGGADGNQSARQQPQHSKHPT